jgi:uncharacterized membrane protein YfcA
MEWIGYIMAALIGVSLGLIGAGGSVLAVPVLAYLFGQDEKMATAYSLFIVGIGAVAGSLSHRKRIQWRAALFFGLPSLLGVFAARNFLLPALPDILFQTGDWELSRRMGIFGLFALLMLLAAYQMIKGRIEHEQLQPFRPLLLMTQGLLVGLLTGLVGAGGGFLIIPALIASTGMKMKNAVGTTLVIISIKSLIGFGLSDARTLPIDWGFLISFSALTILGIVMGSFVSRFVEGNKLKTGMGIFILIMAIFIFWMEFASA